MKIVLFHPTLLPPRDYGGVERVVLWLAKGLLERGHEVFVAAFPGSLLPKGAHLIPIEPKSSSPLELRKALPPGVALVHFMAPPGEEAIRRLACPSLTTVHGNGKPGEHFPVNSVFLSANHASRHQADAFVYNGLDPEEYRFLPSDQKESWFLFLSKTSWKVKNLSGAMRYCSRAGVPLRIAGGNRPFALRFKSWLSPRQRWIGPVGGEKKSELLARGRALVFPVEWPEPFGLAVIEALVSGTPVLASPRGSLPELLPEEAGVGALLSTEEEWVEALRSAQTNSPWSAERCREWVERKFHYRVMAEAYERCYQKVSAGELLNPKPPIAGDWRTET